MDWMIPEKLKKRVSYARFVTNSIGLRVLCQTYDPQIPRYYRDVSSERSLKLAYWTC